jgi:hypothetical protein
MKPFFMSDIYYSLILCFLCSSFTMTDQVPPTKAERLQAKLQIFSLNLLFNLRLLDGDRRTTHGSTELKESMNRLPRTYCAQTDSGI